MGTGLSKISESEFTEDDMRNMVGCEETGENDYNSLEELAENGEFWQSLCVPDMFTPKSRTIQDPETVDKTIKKNVCSLDDLAKMNIEIPDWDKQSPVNGIIKSIDARSFLRKLYRPRSPQSNRYLFQNKNQNKSNKESSDPSIPPKKTRRSKPSPIIINSVSLLKRGPTLPTGNPIPVLKDSLNVGQISSLPLISPKAMCIEERACIDSNVFYSQVSPSNHTQTCKFSRCSKQPDLDCNTSLPALKPLGFVDKNRPCGCCKNSTIFDMKLQSRQHLSPGYSNRIIINQTPDMVTRIANITTRLEPINQPKLDMNDPTADVERKKYLNPKLQEIESGYFIKAVDALESKPWPVSDASQFPLSVKSIQHPNVNREQISKTAQIEEVKHCKKAESHKLVNTSILQKTENTTVIPPKFKTRTSRLDSTQTSKSGSVEIAINQQVDKAEFKTNDVIENISESLNSKSLIATFANQYENGEEDANVPANALIKSNESESKFILTYLSHVPIKESQLVSPEMGISQGKLNNGHHMNNLHYPVNEDKPVANEKTSDFNQPVENRSETGQYFVVHPHEQSLSRTITRDEIVYWEDDNDVENENLEATTLEINLKLNNDKPMNAQFEDFQFEKNKNDEIGELNETLKTTARIIEQTPQLIPKNQMKTELEDLRTNALNTSQKIEQEIVSKIIKKDSTEKIDFETKKKIENESLLKYQGKVSHSVNIAGTVNTEIKRNATVLLTTPKFENTEEIEVLKKTVTREPSKQTENSTTIIKQESVLNHDSQEIVRTVSNRFDKQDTDSNKSSKIVVESSDLSEIELNKVTSKTVGSQEHCTDIQFDLEECKENSKHDAVQAVDPVACIQSMQTIQTSQQKEPSKIVNENSIKIDEVVTVQKMSHKTTPENSTIADVTFASLEDKDHQCEEKLDSRDPTEKPNSTLYESQNMNLNKLQAFKKLTFENQRQLRDFFRLQSIQADTGVKHILLLKTPKTELSEPYLNALDTNQISNYACGMTTNVGTPKPILGEVQSNNVSLFPNTVKGAEVGPITPEHRPLHYTQGIFEKPEKQSPNWLRLFGVRRKPHYTFSICPAKLSKDGVIYKIEGPATHHVCQGYSNLCNYPKYIQPFKPREEEIRTTTFQIENAVLHKPTHFQGSIARTELIDLSNETRNALTSSVPAKQTGNYISTNPTDLLGHQDIVNQTTSSTIIESSALNTDMNKIYQSSPLIQSLISVNINTEKQTFQQEYAPTVISQNKVNQLVDNTETKHIVDTSSDFQSSFQPSKVDSSSIDLKQEQSQSIHGIPSTEIEKALENVDPLQELAGFVVYSVVGNSIEPYNPSLSSCCKLIPLYMSVNLKDETNAANSNVPDIKREIHSSSMHYSCIGVDKHRVVRKFDERSATDSQTQTLPT